MITSQQGFGWGYRGNSSDDKNSIKRMEYVWLALASRGIEVLEVASMGTRWIFTMKPESATELVRISKISVMLEHLMLPYWYLSYVNTIFIIYSTLQSPSSFSSFYFICIGTFISFITEIFNKMMMGIA